MLGVYTVPFLFRPIDFIQNFRSYTLGFITYFLLLPMFLEVFPIYSICNLHDVSWGNRPTSTGTEAFATNKQE
jgi:cellulose synthase/poly-beta-1,6-N-acetylglucosamine synthase-like glycosyltransferase